MQAGFAGVIRFSRCTTRPPALTRTLARGATFGFSAVLLTAGSSGFRRELSPTGSAPALVFGFVRRIHPSYIGRKRPVRIFRPSGLLGHPGWRAEFGAPVNRKREALRRIEFVRGMSIDASEHGTHLNGNGLHHYKVPILKNYDEACQDIGQQVLPITPNTNGRYPKESKTASIWILSPSV